MSKTEIMEWMNKQGNTEINFYRLSGVEKHSKPGRFPDIFTCIIQMFQRYIDTIAKGIDVVHFEKEDGNIDPLKGVAKIPAYTSEQNVNNR